MSSTGVQNTIVGLEDKPWYKIPSLLKLYFLLVAPLITSTSWGFDLSLTNGLQSVAVFMHNFGNPAGATLGFYGASSSVGALVSLPFAGYLVDHFGRRILCAIGSTIVIAMAIMETFSSSFHMFCGAKLLLGFGAVMQQVGGPILVTELAHPKQREALTSLYNTSIYIGLVIGSWVTFGTYPIPNNWSWKIPALLQTVLPVYQLVMIWFCPESPRWLVTKGRVEEARAILIKYHGNGKETNLVRAEFQEILAGVEADKSQLKFDWPSIKVLVGTRANQRRMFCCFVVSVASQCAGSSLISTYLPEVLDQIGYSSTEKKTLINGTVWIFSWVVSVAAAFIIPHVRRRSFFVFSTAGMLGSFVVWTALSAQYVETSRQGFGLGVVVMIFIYEFFYSICFIPMVVTYPLEIVTTKQRGVFYIWNNFCISGSSFAVSYINPIGLQNITWKYYIIQTVFIAILLVAIYLGFPETKGLTLEEVVAVFGDKEIFENAVSHVATAMNKDGAVETEHTEIKA